MSNPLTRISWADCDDDSHVLPASQPMPLYRWALLVALITIAAWAFLNTGW